MLFRELNRSCAATGRNDTADSAQRASGAPYTLRQKARAVASDTQPSRLRSRTRQAVGAASPPGTRLARARLPATMQHGTCGARRSAPVQPPPRALGPRASPAASVRPVAPAGRAGLRLARRLRHPSVCALGNGNGRSANGGTGVAQPLADVTAESSGSPFTLAAAEASPALRGALNDGIMARWLLELRSNGALVRQAVPVSDVGKVRARGGRGIARRARRSVTVRLRFAAAPLTRFAPLRSTFSARRTGGSTATPGATGATS
jgi:hypothetical protein